MRRRAAEPARRAQAPGGRRDAARATPVALAALLVALACAPPAPAPRHLILISVDTLRADRLGAYGYARAATPSFDALAAASLRFERAYAHASLTVPSTASLLTGRLPAEHGVVNNAGRIPAGVPTLAEQLRAAGFETAAFVGNWALRRGRGFERSFDAYTERFVGREAVRPHPENPGAHLTDGAIAWLDARPPGRRLFLWVHYQEPHGPYTPKSFDPARIRDARPAVLPRSASNSGRGGIPAYQWLGHGRLAEYLARYDGEIAEMDRQLGRLLDALRERALLEASLVVFTADHGEAFGEEGIFLAHGEGLGEALIRVPLLLRAPGLPAGRRHDRVRLIDVVPTVLDVLSVAAPGGLPGRSLLRDEGDRVLAAQIEPIRGATRWRSVRDGRFELREEHPGATELRDLASGGAALPPGERREERARLSSVLDELAPWTPEPARRAGDLGEEEREALRALGYVD